MTTETVRWGILGAARVNERLLPAIIAADNAELVAIASRRKGAAAEILAKLAPEQNSVQTMDDPLMLLTHPEIDAIYLPMANEEHAEWALKAIENGKHVLIEKPMALSVDDIEAIERAANKFKVKVMEGFMYVFHPQHKVVQEIIDSGAIGPIRTVRTCFSFPMKPARLYRINRDIAHGGGAMWDIGPYAIHTARKWFENPAVSAIAMAKLNEYGADVSLSGVLDFDEGRYAQFDISFEHARRSEYEIMGTLGGIKCETVWNNPDDKPIVSWWTDAGECHHLALDAANHFVLEVEHFSQCILTDRSPRLTFEDARENCRAIQAVLESVTTGRKVSIF